MSEKETKIITVAHPLEEFFGIESGTTEAEEYVETTTELVIHDDYDSKDQEIEQDIQRIHDEAMGGYDAMAQEVHNVEGRYKARVGEVALQHLITALSAIKEKANLKKHRDTISQKERAAGPSNVTNNVFMDRNDLLEALKQKKESND